MRCGKELRERDPELRREEGMEKTCVSIIFGRRRFFLLIMKTAAYDQGSSGPPPATFDPPLKS